MKVSEQLVEVAVACSNILGESATWSVREQCLFWVDIRAPALHRLDPVIDEHCCWPMPELCGAVVVAGRGVVVALRNRIARFEPSSGELSPLLEIEPAALDNRLNEAKCDRSGRLWIGSMRDFGAAVTGSLYAIEPDLRLRKTLTGVRIPNSLAWSPDGEVMYFADTGEGIVRRYAFEPATGSMREPSTLIGMHEPGRPDGSTVDAEGFIWNTRYGEGRVLRASPDGQVVASIKLPTAQPTSCALGGPDLRTLYITTAKQKLGADDLARQPAAGHLFAVRVDTPGLADTEFSASVG